MLKSALRTRYWVAALAGPILAVLVWKILALELRFAVAIIGGLVFISVVMMGVSRINDILVYAMIFNIPFSIFDNKLFFKQDVLYAPTIGLGIGVAESLIVLAYAVWFARIFIARKEKLPSLGRIDCFILFLIFVQIIAALGARNRALAAFDTIYTIRHVLMYFFIAHHLKRKHLKYVVVLFAFAILLEGGLAGYERVTGNVGVMGKTKGKASHSDLGTQHIVPGLEGVIKAEGTSVEPHELALYLAMILPVPFVLMMMRNIRISVRLLLVPVFIVGVVAMVLTFSRSGWLSFAISILCAVVVIVFFWKQAQGIVVFLVLLLAVSLFYPSGYKLVYSKFAEAPEGLLLERYAQMRTATSVWRNNFLFGYGGANYCLAFDDPDVSVYCAGQTPVHNMYLYFAAELGLCGFIAFYGIVVSAVAGCWKALRCDDWLTRAFALATVTGLFAAMLDGLTGPLLRSPVAYAQLWIYFGFSMAFLRIVKRHSGIATSLVTARNELEQS